MGFMSQRTRLIREESLEFEERFRKWSTSGNLDPESDVQEFLVFQLVGDSFEIERVRELRLERRKERIDKAEENELADVEETGEMLFFDPCGPAAISGTRTHDWRKVRTSWTGKNPDPDRPAALVTKLESTALGLYWLLDRWTELHERLEGGGFWSRGDRLRACRLMGRQMLDAMDDRCVADVLACSYVLRPIGKQFSEFESDMDEFTKDAYVKDLRARYKDLVGKDEPERARQILIELVDEHVALIGEMLAEHEQEDPEERARRTIKMLALDLSPVGDKIGAYEAKFKNSFRRGFESYQKYKATKKKREGGEWDGGGGGGIPAAGRSGVTLRTPRRDGGDVVVDDADVATCGGYLPERCVAEDGGESGVSNLETQMEMGGQGEQVESALAAASATQFESTCPTREEGNPQNEAKLDEHPGEPARQVLGFRVAFYRLCRRHGDQSRRFHARPGRRHVCGQGADRQGHLLEQGRHLGDHRLCGLGVHLLRFFLGRERQDRRHGAVRRTGRARRRHRRQRSPGSRAHAGAPVELPAPGTGVRRHPPGGPTPGPA